MSEPRLETPKNFIDFIELKQELTPGEAISRLAEFHHTTEDVILDHFMNLRDFQEGKVVFEESANSGHPCIVMKGIGLDGRKKWDHLIDAYTGRPQTRTS